MFPQTSHDEIERINFLAQMNRHLSARVVPGVKAAYENEVAPAFTKVHGRPIADRHEARRALLEDGSFCLWSAIRRMTMEQRQQAGRWTAIRQREALAQKVAELTDGDERLKLNPNVAIPRYVSAVDHHCMPGSYYTEAFPGDVANAANYDHGNFVTTAGLLGKFADGGGHAVVKWMKRNYPDFKPATILEIGGTVGHSGLPIAQAYPEAEMTIVDLGAPVLRYGLARAKSLGVENVSFVQASGEDLAIFPDASFDWIQTTMFLHELSSTALDNILRETRRLLKPGGIVLHVEQPQYTPDMPLFEQTMRDWDAFYNNEPFWSRMHELDLDQHMVAAGFGADTLIHGGVTAVVDKDLFPDAADDETEDYGRKAAWHVIGASI
ncbi:class I SAM-dependent methyltransferase [Sphingomonas panacis]|uniref:class I SAM-dependent methyltransferase n=1 Tax=Sphingomonas panacis TaxID=1560345 RepID=UPI001F0B41A0|nr:class I SAM-dependent methyltransferase [Sphingomonas panacis]